MQHQQSQSSSQNDCYSTNEQYFLDICRFGQFDQIKQFLSTLTQQTKFDWEWASNSGDNFVRNFISKFQDMLSGNNFPQIFVYLMNFLKEKGFGDKIQALINKQNSSGNTPLRTYLFYLLIDYSVITQSKQMLQKLLQYGCDTSILNQFKRTALDEAQMIQKFDIAQILAPVTKQDVQQLKKQFGTMDICNEDSDQEQEEQNENKQKDEKQQKMEEK